MRVLRISTGILPVLIFLLLGLQTLECQEQRVIRIGISLDGPWHRNQELVMLLEKEINDALSSQAEVKFPKVLTGDWTKEKVSALNDELLNDREIDCVIGFGLLSSFDLAKRKNFPKPVIAPVVIDPSHQKISFSSGTSGVKNLCYLIYPDTFQRDLEQFGELVGFKKLVVIASRKYHKSLEVNDAPTEKSGTGENSGKAGKWNMVTLFYDNSADEVLSEIPKDADAVYLHIVPMPEAEFQKITKELIKRRLPSFSFLGEYDVRRGIMAAASPDIFPRMIRRIALNVQRIALGDDPGMLGVTFSPAKRLYINLKTAYSVGVSPKWNTLLEAELIQLDSTAIPGAQNLTLKSAVSRISAQNLDILSKLQEMNAASDKISIARSSLLPRIDLNASGLQIDQDRAAAGYQPERRGTVDFSVSQVLFSEQALANISIQSSLYDSKKDEFEVMRLNTVSEGAKLYLNYLRTRKLFYILLENLRLMRQNLEIASIRQSTGTAGPEEKLRWEAEIADMRKTAMEVQSQMNQVQLALKQVMNIPLIYSVNITDVSLDDPELIISDARIRSYLEDPVSFDLMTDYLVQEGIKSSREITQISSLMEAQNRNLTSIRYSYYTPAITAFATYSNTFYKSRINQPFQLKTLPSPPGSIPAEFPAYMGQLLSLVSPGIPDNNDWSLGLQVSLNLSDGFATRFTEQKTVAELSQLDYQKKSVEDKIALRIRYEMETLKAAYFGIQQSKIEQEAAQKTLRIVTDAYSRGALSILSLMDAQASALRADQISVNAYYDLFIGYMQLQRAIGKYDFFLSPDERSRFSGGLIDFMESKVKR
ncbi:MAG: TolC family protein [Ignavibacteria bacterium]|jgi:outer membrane protein TolC|nr:TolC family protein [Ignavibacteria bacterium]MCU7502146.1 TolC family protein [Ignavibacteria bacterium]MCU7515548.1 TolC family protein [Ignavibacteria bacterium]